MLWQSSSSWRYRSCSELRAEDLQKSWRQIASNHHSDSTGSTALSRQSRPRHFAITDRRCPCAVSSMAVTAATVLSSLNIQLVATGHFDRGDIYGDGVNVAAAVLVSIYWKIGNDQWVPAFGMSYGESLERMRHHTSRVMSGVSCSWRRRMGIWSRRKRLSPPWTSSIKRAQSRVAVHIT